MTSYKIIFGNKKAGTAKTTIVVILNPFPLSPDNKKALE